MAILTYFDASGDARQPILGVAGFLARPEQWAVFEKEWLLALTSEGVSELHMKQFAHSRGEYGTWKGDEKRRADFLERLTGIINRHTLKSVTASLFVDHYNDFNARMTLRERLGGPYAFTSVFVLTLARTWRDQNFPGEPISFVFESGDNDQSDLLKTIQNLKMDGDFDVTFMPKHWNEGEVRRYHYAFQACDLLAYEIAKGGRTLLEQDVVQGKVVDEIKARQSLRQIAPTERDSAWRFIDTGLLTEFCKAFRVRRRIT